MSGTRKEPDLSVSAFARAAKAARLKVDLTQEEVAYLIGCCRPTLLYFEKGKVDISFSLALRLSKVLGIDLSPFVADSSINEVLVTLREERLRRQIDQLETRLDALKNLAKADV